MLRRSFQGLLACLLLACSNESAPTEPVSGLPHAVATNSCGPADGPMVVIFLAAQPVESLQPVAPYVQVHIQDSFNALRGGTVFRISESYQDANAWFHGSGVERTASGGEIGVTLRTSTAIAGYVDLRFPDGVGLRGTFSATWTPRQLLCG